MISMYCYEKVIITTVTSNNFFFFLTCLSEDSKGQWQLVFALRQQRDGNAAADSLHLVGMLAGLADGPENLPHPPPVLLLCTKLSERKA